LQRTGFFFTIVNNKSELRKRLFKFFLIGGLNYPINLALVWFMTESVGINYLISVIISYSLITISNFFWHSGYIFQSTRNKSILIKYLISIVFFYIAYIFIVRILTEWFGFYYILSIIISMSVLFSFKFFIFNNYIFLNLDDSN
jgi:putative flippase GtrA